MIIRDVAWLRHRADPQPELDADTPPVYWRGPPAPEGDGIARELVLRICPKPMADRQAIEIMRLASLYQQGIMPFAGGYYDQPVAVMRAIDLALNARERARANKPKPGGADAG